MLKAKLDPKHPTHFVKRLSFFHGRDWLFWTPEVYQATLRNQFGFETDGEDGALRIERAEALREVLRSNRVFEDITVYENVVHALNETHFTAGILEPCSAEELCYGNWVLSKVDDGLEISDEESKWRLAPAVRSYGATCLLESGLHFAPKELGLSAFQEDLSTISDAPPISRALMSILWDRIWNIEVVRTPKRLMERSKAEIDALRGKEGVDGDNLSEDEELACRTIVRLMRCCLYLDNRGVELASL